MVYLYKIDKPAFIAARLILLLMGIIIEPRVTRNYMQNVKYTVIFFEFY